MPDQQLPTEPVKKKDDFGIRAGLMLALQLAWNMGWIIALPVVVLGFGGAYADKYFGTSPLFILLGFALAITLSTVGLKRRLKVIIEKRL